MGVASWDGRGCHVDGNRALDVVRCPDRDLGGRGYSGVGVAISDVGAVHVYSVTWRRRGLRQGLWF